MQNSNQGNDILRKFVIAVIAIIFVLVGIYFLKTYLRPVNEAVEDTPVSDMFDMMEQVQDER